MSREVNKLSALKLKDYNEPKHYLDGGGLYLQVSKFKAKIGAENLSKSWIFKYTLDGRTREMGLGPLTTVSLAEARDLAKDARQLLLQKKDPIAVRDADRQVRQVENAKLVTFDDCAKSYIKAHQGEWRNPKHAQQWTNSLTTYCSPFLGKLYVCNIDTALVLKCLEPIWPTKTETGTRVRGRLEKVLDWAESRGYRTGKNPARWKGHLEFSLADPSKIAPVKNQPALPYKQLPTFFAALQKREGTAAAALSFCILCTARSGDVRGATWGEVDDELQAWVIPTSRMKRTKAEQNVADKFHVVPLAPKALAILKARKEEAGEVQASDLIFPGDRGRQMSDGALAAVIKRMNGKEPVWVDPIQNDRPVVPHGFRATFSTWTAECTTHDRDIREKALAHQVGDETSRAYQRGELLEKRRYLMDDWADYCEGKFGGANIVPIKSRTAA